MNGHSNPIDTSPISPTSTITSDASSSSSHAPPAQQSPPGTQRPLRTLPPPPPADRVPPPKGKSTQTPGHQKFGKMLRKGKDKDKTRDGDEDDDWALEGNPIGARESSDLARPLEGEMEELNDSQLTEVPKEKKKGRGLVKKTSRLFMRNGSSHDDIPTVSSRQASFSSTGSSDSQNATSLRTHFSAFSRSQKNASPPQTARRTSQDSQKSWQPTQKTGRSGSSSTYESRPEVPQKHHRRGSSHLSASVPSLSRNNLPIPAVAPSSQETLPSRMSSWFSHLLPSTSTATIENSSNEPPSPARKGPSTAASFLNAARQKAVGGVRYLLDSEATPDKCEDTIWVLGVGHPGWRPSTPRSTSDDLPDPLGPHHEPRRGSGSSGKPSPPAKEISSLRPPAWPARRQKESNGPASPSKGFGQLFSASTLSLALPLGAGSPSKESENGDSPSKKGKEKKEVIKWPDQFYDDFRSRIWCTYRSQYAPILSLPQPLLLPNPKSYYPAFSPPESIKQPSMAAPIVSSLPTRGSSPWGWSKSDERGLTTDAGWGCMLRTGQSMLANALIHLHLGRDWRIPHKPEAGASREAFENYAEYVKVLSWFLDDPSPLVPFSVHRMALIGKELGKEVGEWFGPSTAAGALKTLANSFPLCGVVVTTATDGIVYKSDVYTASNLPSPGWVDGDNATGLPSSSQPSKWGSKAALVLVGIRLGLDGVNPIYFDSIKALFTFPQSVGIAGGRPSSSYYFVASQANSLFYLDPHFTRPAVPLETPPAPLSRPPSEPLVSPDEEAVVVERPTISYTLDVVDVDDISDDSELDESPSKRKTKSPPRSLPRSGTPRSTPPGSPSPAVTPSTPSTPTANSRPINSRLSSAQESVTSDINLSGPSSNTLWYVNAYSENQLRTFHCEKVKKMPLSGLDPSMLLGFLCKDEAEFDDFCERVSKLPQKIFTIQDDPPSWDEEDDTGLESVSEPDLDDLSDTGVRKSQSDDEIVSADTTLEAIVAPRTAVRVEGRSSATYQRVAPLTQPQPPVRPTSVTSDIDGESSSSLPVLLDKPPNADTRLTEEEGVSSDFGRLKLFPSGQTQLGEGVRKEEGKMIRPVGNRDRLESWVEPSSGGEEAPNGDSIV